MQLANLTPLVAERHTCMDSKGAETLVVIVKGTWLIHEENGQDATLTLADPQQPIRYLPEYWGEMGESSLRYDSDLFPEKPGTDCLLLGHAYAPTEDTRELDVRFAVGPIDHTVRVFGARRWQKRLFGTQASPPEPFSKQSLRYEHAYGGIDHSSPHADAHEHCATNPVGTGFRTRSNQQNIHGEPLPNLERPADLIRTPKSQPQPIGFSPIAPHWQPRQGAAGTYDEHWQTHIFPLLPDDFTPRFYSCAPDELCSTPHLRGDEKVLIEHASPSGRLAFQLPDVCPQVVVKTGLQGIELPVKLDTLIVEPDERRVQLVWRTHLNAHGQLHRIEWIRIQMDQHV